MKPEPAVAANTTFSYPVYVVATDANGNVDPDFDGSLPPGEEHSGGSTTLTVGANPGGALLQGGGTAKASHGASTARTTVSALDDEKSLAAYYASLKAAAQ